MIKEQIEALALEAYPIKNQIICGDKTLYDENKSKRKAYIEGLTKASELLYSEEQMKESFNEGYRKGADDNGNVGNRQDDVSNYHDAEYYLQSLKQQ